jgi:hypothetical protein
MKAVAVLSILFSLGLYPTLAYKLSKKTLARCTKPARISLVIGMVVIVALLTTGTVILAEVGLLAYVFSSVQMP